jgi:mRNA-degrading endonuclease toxin of MazEF toxin-antitoxin module
MKAWEIWSYQPAGWSEPHPCVIVSSPQRVNNKPEVNVLLCSSQRAAREALDYEVILDAGDGLDWPTLCKCDLLHMVPKTFLKNRRGAVSSERRTAIIRAINRSNGWV